MRARAAGAVSLTLTSDAKLMQEYLQAQGILVSTQNDGVNQAAAFQNAEGQSEAIVIDSDGQIARSRRSQHAAIPGQVRQPDKTSGEMAISALPHAASLSRW